MKSNIKYQAYFKTQTVRFTLIELIVSMAVFTLIMFVLISFFDSAQKTWSMASAKIETYQNARIGLNLITRDLQSAFYTYNKLFIHDNAVSPYKYEKLCFIAQTELASENAKTKISEIQYTVKTEGNVDWLEVSVTDDTSGKWDIDTASNTFSNYSPFHKIIPYVTNLEFICRDESGSPISKSSSCKKLPYSVQINLSLLDRKSWLKYQATSYTNSDIITNNERTFSKIVFIGDRGPY